MGDMDVKEAWSFFFFFNKSALDSQNYFCLEPSYSKYLFPHIERIRKSSLFTIHLFKILLSIQNLNGVNLGFSSYRILSILCLPEGIFKTNYQFDEIILVTNSWLVITVFQRISSSNLSPTLGLNWLFIVWRS